VDWVHAHKHDITLKFADSSRYPPAPEPVSIFMAGTPGAGKTEYSERLNKEFKNDQAVLIDADKIRCMIGGYTGKNSYIYQKACTAAVGNLYGHALKNKQNLILDGTFAYEHSMDNIERSLKVGRKAMIYFIYQNPIKAWEITKAREAEDGRRVFKDKFIEAYFKARANVKNAKDAYGNSIEINLVIKEYEKTGQEKVELNISSIDGYLGKVYTMEELERIIL
jgi:predicted ABC-type ATPase